MNNHHVRYIPPTEESIQAFAQLLCERLATTRNDEKFTRPEVITGLANFLNFALRIEAKKRSTVPASITNTCLSGE